MPASERRQTYTLYVAATGVEINLFLLLITFVT